MAKGSGGTRNARRNSLSLNLVSGEYDDLLQDAKKIFEKEASDNLGCLLYTSDAADEAPHV